MCCTRHARPEYAQRCAQRGEQRHPDRTRRHPHLEALQVINGGDRPGAGGDVAIAAVQNLRKGVDDDLVEAFADAGSEIAIHRLPTGATTCIEIPDAVIRSSAPDRTWVSIAASEPN